MAVIFVISANSCSFRGALRKRSRSLSHLLMSSCIICVHSVKVSTLTLIWSVLYFSLFMKQLPKLRPRRYGCSCMRSQFGLLLYCVVRCSSTVSAKLLRGYRRDRVRLLGVFWRTVTSNGSSSATEPLSCLSVCNVGVLWPNGWMDQDATWYRGRPLPKHIVLDGDPALTDGKEHSTPSTFGPCLLCQTVAHLCNSWALVIVAGNRSDSIKTAWIISYLLSSLQTLIINTW